MDDINSLVAPKGTINVVIKHPQTDKPLKNKDGSDMTIEIYGTNSKEYRSVLFRLADKQLENKQRDSETIHNDEIDLLVSITKGWNITKDGKALEFSVDTAKELYEDSPIIRRHIETAQRESLAFMKA